MNSDDRFFHPVVFNWLIVFHFGMIAWGIVNFLAYVGGYPFFSLRFMVNSYIFTVVIVLAGFVLSYLKHGTGNGVDADG